MGTDAVIDNPAPRKTYAVVDDGRVFLIALLASLTWTITQHNPFRSIRESVVTLLASMLFVYLLGTPFARLAYQLFGKRPSAARIAFTLVALTIIGAMAACA
jgi:hypothetical protein